MAANADLQISPTEFDLIVVGTGVEESLIASSAAALGKRVLQLEERTLYGGAWASLTWPELQSWVQSLRQAGEHEQALYPWAACWSTTDAAADRSFTIDLAPQVIYGAGELLRILLSCSAHLYLDFHLLPSSFIHQGGRRHRVPGSRSAVFQDPRLAPQEKHAFMKFIRHCQQALEGQGPLQDAFQPQRAFRDVLAEQSLPSHLVDTLQYAIALQTTTPPPPPPVGDALQVEQGTAQPVEVGQLQPELARFGGGLSAYLGLGRLVKYLQSSGRYGPPDSLPFVINMYGAGDISQAFCRATAVKGGIQVLTVGLAAAHTDGDSSAQAAQQPSEGAASTNVNESEEVDHPCEGEQLAAGDVELAPTQADVTGAGTATQRVVGITATNGQRLACSALVVGPHVDASAILSPRAGFAPGLSAKTGPSQVAGSPPEAADPPTEDGTTQGGQPSVSGVQPEGDTSRAQESEQGVTPALAGTRVVRCAALVREVELTATQGLGSGAVVVWPPGELGDGSTLVTGLAMGAGLGVAPAGCAVLYLQSELPSPSQEAVAARSILAALATLARPPVVTPAPPGDEAQPPTWGHPSLHAIPTTDADVKLALEAVPDWLAGCGPCGLGTSRVEGANEVAYEVVGIAMWCQANDAHVAKFGQEGSGAVPSLDLPEATTEVGDSVRHASNVVWCNPPDGTLCYDEAVRRAKAGFRALYPELLFLGDQTAVEVDDDIEDSELQAAEEALRAAGVI